MKQRVVIGLALVVVGIGIEAGGSYGVFVRRADDGSELMINLTPHRHVAIALPRETAVRLRLAKSRGSVTAVDDVDLQCAKTTFALHDVAGEVRVRGAPDEQYTCHGC